mmetsp:Transcript_35244/g.64427  ORF Transcript_35244/g.64427 Transcript_35244/m.64427 type:complete len:578 (+) Transcript_35244:119-1852(+)
MPLNPFAAVDAVLEAHEQVSNSKLPHAAAPAAKATLPPSDVKFKAPPPAEPTRPEPVANGAPHPSLLLIRQGIAAQDKAAVRAAMAAAEAAGVQIEAGMRAMLFQWLGDAPLPVATPAGVPDSGAQVASGAVGHTGLGTSASAAESPPAGVVESSPHPALLQIREGIASQNRDAVRAAVASARAAQVVIEPRLYNMIMQWLSEGASQTENREMAPPAGALAPALPTEAPAETSADAANAAMGMVHSPSFPAADALPCGGVPGMPMAFPPGPLPPPGGTGLPTPSLPAPIYPPKAPWHMAPQPLAKVAAPAMMNLGMTAKGSAPPPAAHANGVAPAARPLVGVNRDLAGLADEAARRRLELEAKQKRAREASKPAGLKSVDTAGLPPDAARALLELLADPGRPVAGPGVISAAPVRRKSEALESSSAPDPNSSTAGADKATPEPAAKVQKRDGAAPPPEEAAPPPPPSDGPPPALVPAAPPPPEAAAPAKAASSASDSSDDDQGAEASKPAAPEAPAPAAASGKESVASAAAAAAPKAAPSQGGQATSAGATSKELESWQYLKGNSWGAGNFFDFNSF